MLKGHTKIELTDVNTGEVTVHEEDNMFTNAIYKTLNNTWTSLVGGVSTLKNWHLPLSQKMLGGIALFEDTIEETETMNHFPKGNRVIATAGTIASDGMTKNWGSRNSLESETFDPETNSVKHVWDFSTAEANGRISAVGLMDGRQADYYGQSAWNKIYNRGLNVTSYFSDYGKYIAEFKGDIFVTMTNGTGQVIIKKVKFNFDTVSLNNNLGTTEVVSEKTVSLPNPAMNYTCTYWFDGDDGYWYGFIYCNSGFDSAYYTSDITDYTVYSSYMQVIRINKDSYSVDYHNVTLPSSVYPYPKVAHPLITDYYIVLPYSTSYYWYDDNGSSTRLGNMCRNKVCCISKSDWTCTVKELKDADDNIYSMYSPINNPVYMRHFFYGCWSNLKLKNGLYQMQDIIFDDNVVVQEQVKPPMNTSTNAPASETYVGWLYSNLNPFYSGDSMYYSNNSAYYNGNGLFMLPNEEKEIILIGFYGGGATSGWIGANGGRTFTVFLVPYDGQKLMTINNLSTPVTKTAAQTMKVTYTITDVVDA